MSYSRTDLAAQVAANSGESKARAEAMVNHVLGAIAHAARCGETVDLRGFGSFSVKVRGERNGRNPQTGETVRIAASRRLAFRPSRKLEV